MSIAEMDENLLEEWGNCLASIKTFLIQSPLNEEQQKELMRLISNYEDLGRKRSRIITAIQLIRENMTGYR